MSKEKVSDDGKLKARPQIEGLDPLAGADRLYNDSDSSGTHYRVDNTERKRDEMGVSSGRVTTNPFIQKQHIAPAVSPSKAKNLSKKEQDEVAKNRKEKVVK